MHPKDIELFRFAKFIGFTETADTLVDEYVKSLPTRPIDESDIIRAVAHEYCIEVERLFIHAHPRPVSEPRMVCMFLINQYLKYPFQRTGGIFNKHHATAIHAVKTVIILANTNKQFRERLLAIVKKLGIDEKKILRLLRQKSNLNTFNPRTSKLQVLR